MSTKEDHKSNSQVLFEELVDALHESGYDLLTSLEWAHVYMKELKALKPGKHKVYAGDYCIEFRIAAPVDTV